MGIHLYELIAKNKRNSLILIFLVTLLLVLTGYFIGATFNAYYLGIGIAVLISGVLSSVSYFAGDKVIMLMMGGREIEKRDYQQLCNVVEEMAIAGGVPMPKVYVIESNASNAFACGRNPRNSAIAVTTGIMEILSRDELQGAVAHEIAHIRNYDILHATLMSVMVGVIVIACDMFLRSQRRMRREKDRREGQMQVIMYLIAIMLAVIAPILAKIIQFAMSRQREYLADATSAELTRNPESLASALEKIAADKDPLEIANRGIQHLFIINPANPLSPEKKGITGLFTTHPPLGERVKILREIAHTYRQPTKESS